MTQQLKPDHLLNLVETESLDDLTLDELIELFRAEPSLQEHKPSGEFARDPRTGDRVLYAPGRSSRPHHTQDQTGSADAKTGDCPICAGQTTGVVDVAELTEGYTFINKNMYPMLYPFAEPRPARGLHLLQWTSTHHDRDWHNLPPEDCAVVMSRLAALEAKFSADWNAALGEDGTAPVSIIKNSGAAVGASLQHGHQQIAVGGPRPAVLESNARFARREGRTFSEDVLINLPDEFVIQDYGPALLALVPFMKRPYEMFLLLKDTHKPRLHELTDQELGATARGWHDATRALHSLMPRIGRDVAYNVLTFNGPDGGLYFEFLPYSQTLGGFERLGLYICTLGREQAADDLRSALKE